MLKPEETVCLDKGFEAFLITISWGILLSTLSIFSTFSSIFCG